MKLNGLTVEAADGLHDDDWCWPTTRLTLKADKDAEALLVGLWIKPEAQAGGRAMFTVSVGGATPVAQFINFDQPSEIVVPFKWAKSQVVSVKITTQHRASRSPEEKRDLSFSLMRLSAE